MLTSHCMQWARVSPSLEGSLCSLCGHQGDGPVPLVRPHHNTSHGDKTSLSTRTTICPRHMAPSLCECTVSSNVLHSAIPPVHQFTAAVATTTGSFPSRRSLPRTVEWLGSGVYLSFSVFPDHFTAIRSFISGASSLQWSAIPRPERLQWLGKCWMAAALCSLRAIPVFCATGTLSSSRGLGALLRPASFSLFGLTSTSDQTHLFFLGRNPRYNDTANCSCISCHQAPIPCAIATTDTATDTVGLHSVSSCFIIVSLLCFSCKFRYVQVSITNTRLYVITYFSDWKKPQSRDVWSQCS